ncbi:MAG TPA: hypothetical protein VJ438_06120, partial [Candidatus Nanoarchaeia archaeon]|nr:hypothetical protein [Candidatus Nanoarchaeia archaeon]
MAISRRGFLKGAVSAPLTKLASSSKEKNSEEKTPYDGKFEYDLAFCSLDFAEKFLSGIMNRKYTGPHRPYASNIDSAARFIHLKVWDERPLINKVKRVYIPLLEKARDSIDLNDPAEIKKHDPAWIKNNADYPTSAMHTKACIQGRIYNLEN